jgi:E3 ubiquitin-protein ligase HERC3
MGIAAGGVHTCALLLKGYVKCWGSNGAGQLGLGDVQFRGDAPNEMGNDLFAVDLADGIPAVQLGAGGAHTCASLNDGRVKCWGYNGVGELGLGDTSHRGDEPGEMGDALSAVLLF